MKYSNYSCYMLPSFFLIIDATQIGCGAFLFIRCFFYCNVSGLNKIRTCMCRV